MWGDWDVPPVYVPHTLQPIRNQFKIYTHYLIAPGHHHWLSEIFWNIIPTLIQCFTKGETKERTTCYLQRSINPMYQQESEVVGFPALTVLRRGLMPNLCGCAGASYSRRSLGSIFKLCHGIFVHFRTWKFNNYQNCCILIFCWSTNRLIVSALIPYWMTKDIIIHMLNLWRSCGSMLCQEKRNWLRTTFSAYLRIKEEQQLS